MPISTHASLPLTHPPYTRTIFSFYKGLSRRTRITLDCMLGPEKGESGVSCPETGRQMSRLQAVPAGSGKLGLLSCRCVELTHLGNLGNTVCRLVSSEMWIPRAVAGRTGFPQHFKERSLQMSSHQKEFTWGWVLGRERLQA